jgi:hypothetical protein
MHAALPAGAPQGGRGIANQMSGGLPGAYAMHERGASASKACPRVVAHPPRSRCASSARASLARVGCACLGTACGPGSLSRSHRPTAGLLCATDRAAVQPRKLLATTQEPITASQGTKKAEMPDAKKPCGEPACASKSDAMRKMFNKHGKLPVASDTAAAAAQARCPPDREELGKHTWTLLHTFAAYFPQVPTTSQTTAALNFIQALGRGLPRWFGGKFSEG